MTKTIDSFSYGKIFFLSNAMPCNVAAVQNLYSLHLGRKYAGILVLGHYLFLVTHSFSRATLSENCSLLVTDNVRGQIS